MEKEEEDGCKTDSMCVRVLFLFPLIGSQPWSFTSSFQTELKERPESLSVRAPARSPSLRHAPKLGHFSYSKEVSKTSRPLTESRRISKHHHPPSYTFLLRVKHTALFCCLFYPTRAWTHECVSVCDFVALFSKPVIYFCVSGASSFRAWLFETLDLL